MTDLIIDIPTADAKRTAARLARLKSTLAMLAPAKYYQDLTCSQIRLTTTKTLEETETWLWKYSFDYLGVCLDKNSLLDSPWRS